MIRSFPSRFTHWLRAPRLAAGSLAPVAIDDPAGWTQKSLRRAKSDSGPQAPRICFFHQNDVFGMQGGIERYVSTVIGHAGDRVALASPPIAQRPTAQSRFHHFAVHEHGPENAPQWLRFLLGLLAQRGEINAFLRENNLRVLEFSRPEYGLAAWLLHGKRVFTIHGTGPGPGHGLHYLIHHACCLLLPLIADRVQVVGRDPSGVAKIARWALGARLVHVDAWHDDCFGPTPLPPLDGLRPLRVFYAGRIAPQKNPELLFAIIRAAQQKAPDCFEFHYFGSDHESFVQAGLSSCVRNHGYLGPQALAQAIASCHIGLLCSAYGEGSPYIIVEALACGRPFVVSSLPTLVATYGGQAGVHFAARLNAETFLATMMAIDAKMRAGGVDPTAIAAGVASRSQSRAVPELLDALGRLVADTPPTQANR